ncbi:hypothetical protein DL763_011161 [Monosporascus cannonballus]|nr:hypothetical protein DL763_011161 [Monosporascus cannonballus]
MNPRAGMGRRLFLVAVDNKKEAAVKTLLDAHALVEAEDENYASPLHAAIEPGNEAVVQLLLTGIDQSDTAKTRAKLERKDRDCRTPLLFAVNRGLERTVERLLEMKANPNTSGGSELRSPLHVVVAAGRVSITRMLLKPVHRAAAYTGQEGIVVQLLKRGAELNAMDGKYGTALQAAAATWWGDEVVEMLLDAGADFNIRGGEHETALLAALFHDNKRVFKVILERGANTEVVDSDGRTPLRIGVEKGDVGTVRLLLKHRANTESEGSDWDVLGIQDPQTIKRRFECTLPRKMQMAWPVVRTVENGLAFLLAPTSSMMLEIAAADTSKTESGKSKCEDTSSAE